MHGCGFPGVQLKTLQPFVVWMTVAAVIITLLQKSGDIELNPGPGRYICMTRMFYLANDSD